MTGAIGQPLPRVEDLRLLTGRGSFVSDLHLEGMLHAVILRSPLAHGRLRHIDSAAARSLPGVVAIYTAQDVAAASAGRIPTIPMRLMPMPELAPFEQPVIASDRVRYVGEPLAIVLADSPGRAEDALDAIVVEIDSLPVIGNCAEGLTSSTLLFPEQGSNIGMRYQAERDASDAGGAAREAQPSDAAYVRRERFQIQRHAAVPMEPRGVIAWWQAGASHMTVLGAAKVPFANRRILAQTMDLPEECVDMIEGDVGGGFGARGEFHPEDFLVPFAARRSGHAVKWIEDRREHLLASSHARECEIEIEIRCDANGLIQALIASAHVDMGAYVRTAGAIAPRNVAQFLSGPYRIPHIRVSSMMMFTNKSPIGTYRGPGRFEADFFRERLFDMAARDLGLSQDYFRRRNLVALNDMPYRLATLTPVERRETLDGGDYQATLDRCLNEIGWHDKQHLQGQCIAGRYHGLAVGCFIEGGAAGPREYARLDLDATGQVSLYIGSTNIGQGLETVCLQITADALALPLERIQVFHGSTTFLKEGFGSYHSRSVVMGGSAILAAADALKERLRDAAATLRGCAAQDISVGAGLEVRHQGELLALVDLAPAGLSAEGTFSNHHHTYAYGAAAAHIAVEPGTGQIELLDYVNVEDIGRVINPLTAHGQAIGAIVQGLGGALLEHLVYDADGQLQTGTFADYLLPGATDFPRLRAVVLGNYPAPHNPLGAKGGGEGGIVPVGGVIANALAAALSSFDVQPHSLPLSPDRVWTMIEEAGAATDRTKPPQSFRTD